MEKLVLRSTVTIEDNSKLIRCKSGRDRGFLFYDRPWMKRIDLNTASSGCCTFYERKKAMCCVALNDECGLPALFLGILRSKCVRFIISSLAIIAMTSILDVFKRISIGCRSSQVSFVRP